jgi:hypothetical protein
MSQNYLNIIGNWNTQAERGRQRAKAERQAELNMMQNEAKLQIQNEKNSAAASQRLQNIKSQAEALSRFARESDKADMKAENEKALAKLREQLEFYGDDINAFMRGGGREMINEYRDSVLNSETAQMIRNSHVDITKYLDSVNSNPELLSDVDKENFAKWNSGEQREFKYRGDYMKIETISKQELLEANNDLVEAMYLKQPNNYRYNYSIDTGVPLEADVDDREMYRYVSNKITGAQEEIAKNYTLSDAKGGQKSYSKNILDAFAMFNPNYRGDFNGFYMDPSNNTALQQLENITWIQPYSETAGGRNKRVYGQQMFVSESQEIVKELFGGDGQMVTFEQLNSLQGRMGAISVYGENGELLVGGMKNNNDFGFWNRNDDFIVDGIELMFETTDVNGKTKLFTKEELRNEGTRDQVKNPVMTLTLRDKDGLFNPDDYRYVKLDLEKDIVKKVVDDAMGSIQVNTKKSLSNKPESYKFQPGEKFKYTQQNVIGLVDSLAPVAADVFQFNNHSEYDINSASVLIGFSMMENDSVNPLSVLDEFRSSQNSDVKKLMGALKANKYNTKEDDGFYDIYENMLIEDYGQDGFSDKQSIKLAAKDIRDLKIEVGYIKTGFNFYGNTNQQKPEETNE